MCSPFCGVHAQELGCWVVWMLTLRECMGKGGREVAYPKLKFMRKPYGSPLVYKLIKNVTLNEGVVMEFSCIGITRCRLSNKNLSDRH